MARSNAVTAMVCGLLCLSILSGPAAGAAGSPGAERKEEAGAMACASYEQAQRGDGMDLSLKNQCAESLSCSIQWTVSCRGDRGRTSKRELASFDVAEGQTHSVPATADACGTEASWKIADVRWTCRSAAPADAKKREPVKGGSPRKTTR